MLWWRDTDGMLVHCIIAWSLVIPWHRHVIKMGYFIMARFRASLIWRWMFDFRTN
ncbi:MULTISPECIES: hypothetical protein [Nitrosomonas]|uniref:hypothetical protein n=1 Tax=Nitrosomonas TaxID=914 RepID=UPI000AB5C9D8|nr:MULTISPECIES: hypothetical protein [Nitrosomonas]UVS63115.1 hypothetical protein NX761_08495 [Nitrosomonas sp. PLL12]